MENHFAAPFHPSSSARQPPPAYTLHGSNVNPTLMFRGLISEEVGIDRASCSSSSCPPPPRVPEEADHGIDQLLDNSASSSMGAKKVKRERFAFQTRSQVDVLDDGYRWRKYGQKTVKSNRFPRSYYRCTHQGCNVKKQVQRHSKDEGVVVTTYEGVHTHPIDKPNESFEAILNQLQIYNHIGSAPPK